MRRARRVQSLRRFALAGAPLVLALAAACDREEPPGADPSPAASDSRTSSVPAAQPGAPTLPDELAETDPAPEIAAADAGAEAAAEPEWEGPYLAVTAIAAAVYPEPEFDREKKLGYVRNGGRVPVKAEPVSKKRCSGGWYEIVGGGYICGNQGTTDLDDPEVKYSIKPPTLDGVLPYQYARNAKNGTPLYRSIPSKEQMSEYEPYLNGGKKKADKKPAKASGTTSEKSKEKGGKKNAKDETSAAPTRVADDEVGSRDGGAATIPAAHHTGADGGGLLADGGGLLTDGAAEAPKTPWWQREDLDDSLHEVTLEDLSAESDGILAKRLVEGFYVAVDKSFRWNGRLWHKTTKGLIAPADRFWITEGSDFKGVEIGKDWKLPVAWVYGWRKKTTTYEIDEDTKKSKPAGSLGRFDAVQLTGREIEIGKTTFYETTDSVWVKRHHVRRTQPGPPPEDLEGNEKWIDINLDEQTLVAFVGTTPVYATLISSGKKHKKKEKDHRTPTGSWRIREKHVTTTMDGNGTAAGDLPYSIEDVPYVMYFHRSYALHGAFWHRNYGVEMSHGCVNLAPLDAKHLFFFAGPPVPKGWHGAWARDGRPGSRIVVHE